MNDDVVRRQCELLCSIQAVVDLAEYSESPLLAAWFLDGFTHSSVDTSTQAVASHSEIHSFSLGLLLQCAPALY